MVFDVYFTNDTNGTDSSIAKKFTVVKQFGTATDTTASFKILDTGPGTYSSNTIDFTPTFISWSNTTLRCRITPVSYTHLTLPTILLV